MSTRATIHFFHEDDQQPSAIVYRHSDGYPEAPGLGVDLIKFCDELQTKLDDTRFNDPSYLAARWLVWDSANHQGCSGGVNSLHRCDFLGVGVVLEDPIDIEYRYKVICRGNYGKGTRPQILCQQVRCSYPTGIWSVEKEHEIPNRPTRIRAKKKAAAS